MDVEAIIAPEHHAGQKRRRGFVMHNVSIHTQHEPSRKIAESSLKKKTAEKYNSNKMKTRLLFLTVLVINAESLCTGLEERNVRPFKANLTNLKSLQ